MVNPVEWIPIRRRRAIRRSVVMPCEIVADLGFRQLGDVALDLSPDGLFSATNGRRVWLGEEVFVALRAPSGRGWIDAVGHVTRIVHGRRDGDRSAGFGVTFTTIEPRQRARLRRELRGLPPPIPTRRPRPDYALTVRRIVCGG